MEDIILSLEPAFHRVEHCILWQNRYASFGAFVLGNAIFYGIARAGLRPFCAIMLVVLIFHILDCLKQKRSQRSTNDEKELCELTQLILRSYRHVRQTHEQLNTLKTENRVKYSLLIIAVCLILAVLGLRINGYYISYFIMLSLFTLPAIVYHKLIPKLLQRLRPLLEQLDQSMTFERRSLVDQRELLVKLTPTGAKDDDDDDDIRRLRQQQDQLRSKAQPFINASDDDEDDQSDEQKLMDTDDRSQTILNFRQRYQNDAAVVPKQAGMNDSSFDMLSDSSSSVADDEPSHLNELYANMSSDIDGKHRIKIKGDEMKVKGRPSKPRPKLMDAHFFQPTDNNDRQTDAPKPSAPPLFNSATSNPPAEPDLTSFDFLNDYEERQ